MAIVLNSVIPRDPPKDLNIYINEEVRFYDEVFIKVVGLSVDKNEDELGTLDEDGDILTEYTLNLLVSIEQRNTDW